MRKSSFVLPIFLFCVSLALFVLFLASRGWLQFISNSMELSLFPISSFLRSITFPQSKTVNEIEKLRQENARLVSQLVGQNQLKQDNAALRDQFDTTTISSKTLLPVEVVGMPNVVPNSSFPETLIIHAGIKEGVGSGSVLVVKDNVIGVVKSASDNYANVQLISNKQSSFSVKSSQTGAIGVARGQGNGEIVMDNILLSDTISVGDSIVTLGNQDTSGNGYPPNLIVGKVVSVEKNPSSLFQEARIMPLLHYDQITTVFVVKK